MPLPSPALAVFAAAVVPAPHEVERSIICCVNGGVRIESESFAVCYISVSRWFGSGGRW